MISLFWSLPTTVSVDILTYLFEVSLSSTDVKPLPRILGAVVGVAIVLLLQILFASIGKEEQTDTGGIDGFVVCTLTLTLRSNNLSPYKFVTLLVLSEVPKFENEVPGFCATLKKSSNFVPLGDLIPSKHILKYDVIFHYRCECFYHPFSQAYLYFLVTSKLL